MKFGAALFVAISMICASASGASAADTIFWANYSGSATISAANLDGSGSGRDLYTATDARGGSVSAPAGLALDPAAGSIYWSNAGSSSITRGSIDGCAAAALCATNLYSLVAGGPPVDGPGGPAIDVAHGLMYWINVDGELVRASLNGSGAVNEIVNTTGATAAGGGGAGALVIDAARNRIYWTNDDFLAGTISYANLDGSGGGDLNITGASSGRPWGLAIDVATDKLYWANYHGGAGNLGTLGWANLDGSGGGDLYSSASVGCSMLNGANGVAVDHAANKIYWGNFEGSTISSANLDGSGGCANIATTGATMNGPDEVAILKVPAATSTPLVSGTAKSGLTCSAVTWGGDSPEAWFYRSPQSFSYQWKRDGVVVPGANAAALAVTASGSYDCAAIATNAAGSTTSQSSAPIAAKRYVIFAAPKFKRKSKGGKLLLTGKVSPVVKPALSAKDCSGSVSLKLKLKKKTIASKRFALKYKKSKCSAAVSLKIAKKYRGKKVKLTVSIGRSTKLTAPPKTATVKL